MRCYNCGKEGHFKNECMTKHQGQQAQPSNQYQTQHHGNQNQQINIIGDRQPQCEDFYLQEELDDQYWDDQYEEDYQEDSYQYEELYPVQQPEIKKNHCTAPYIKNNRQVV